MMAIRAGLRSLTFGFGAVLVAACGADQPAAENTPAARFPIDEYLGFEPTPDDHDAVNTAEEAVQRCMAEQGFKWYPTGFPVANTPRPSTWQGHKALPPAPDETQPRL